MSRDDSGLEIAFNPGKEVQIRDFDSKGELWTEKPISSRARAEYYPTTARASETMSVRQLVECQVLLPAQQ
jgi:hypothetical protein